VTGGIGGSFPGAGAVTGVWDSSLPTNPLVTTLAVSVPSGATVLKSVVLHALAHTYDGDVHIVLKNPAGASFNVLVMSDSTSPTGGGCFDNFNGDYTIVDPIVGVCSTPSLTCTSTGTTVPTGTYTQNYGTWTSGNAGLSNTGLESIPISSGTWTLSLYDWYPLSDNGTLASWDLCFGTPSTPGSGGTPTACVSGGPGGAYPGAGAITGVWNASLPTNPLVSSLAVTVPPGSTKIVSVKLHSLTHTFGGDTHAVLTAPGGTSYNLLVLSDSTSPTGGGCGDNLGGDYDIVDAVIGTDPCGAPAQPMTCGNGSYGAGTRAQTFGTWTSGNAGLNNTPLQSIPIASGMWTLSIYDWYPPADYGSLASWDLCFDANPIAVTNCQLLATATQGCNSAVSYTGTPSATSASAFNVTFGSLNAVVNGVVFYGLSGPNNVAWSPQSNLCVKTPTQRLGGFPGASGSTGGAIGLCNGAFTFNANALIQSTGGLLGTPMAAGTAVDMQGWQRDPASSKTTNLTDALSFVVGP
jgi:subtilisin-like proprotein convertase family protein